jgi:hypothetical protein
MSEEDSIKDVDEYMILVNAADAEVSFSQLIYDLSNRYPSLKIYEVYKVATEMLEKLLHEQVLEIVKIKYHYWDDVVRTEHLSITESLNLLHKPSIWDQASELNDGVYRLWITDSGQNLLDKYEKILCQ